MSPASINLTRQHISSTPGICGGKPCVAGTRIRVEDIYIWHELQGQSVDEIVSKFPQVTHAAVYAALSYLWDNRQEILDQIKAGEEWVAQLKAKFPSKLGGPGNADPVSS